MTNPIKNMYYSLWADAINYERLKNGGENHWKAFTFVYMSIFMSLNILALLSAVLFFTGYEMTAKLKAQLENIFSSELLVNFSWSLIMLFIPSFVITYFAVFHKNKYEYILENYKFKNGRLLFIYFSLTVIAFFGFSLLNKYL
ncbi:hypothetical protein FJ651_15440 [Paucihalobacter ruber]|uniref:Uncharacterized protein n=1 Tax=Paucihalobacter ruber TaxID=2567861 RepID=A0A506PB94_9FLAO|nr:hypothetical protein [Paucihalobacter ruber]TPV31156.1 hypothetical protein FJ651_15440 [Paucihalobacter ruber]